jgi:DNA-binding MarR family transcriptional regulator
MKKAIAAKRAGPAAARSRPPREVFRLSQSPSHLLRRAEQFAAELFARSLLHDGVTLRQTVLMAAIAEAEGASQSDLVRITGVDRSTLAEMMARMESRGLIARAAAADDGRAKSVRLTADGRRRLESGLPVIRAVDRALLAAVPAAKRGAFQTILSELSETADREHVAAEQAERVAKKAAPKARRKPKAEPAASRKAPRKAARRKRR